VIPPLNPTTGLLPQGRHVCSAAEVEDMFVKDSVFPGSSTRSKIWNDWNDGLALLQSAVPVHAVWIGGSFTTSKLDPGDIDVTYVANAEQARLQQGVQEQKTINTFSTPGSVKATLQLDTTVSSSSGNVSPSRCHPAPTSFKIFITRHLDTGTTGGSERGRDRGALHQFRRTACHGEGIWRCQSVTTSAERLAALQARVLASPVEPLSDPEELTRRAIKAQLEETGGSAIAARAEMGIRMHGPGVPAHDIPVRQAVGILGPLQEAIASIGQALLQKATSSGRIKADVLHATELRLSPPLLPGSVVFRLAGPEEYTPSADIHELLGTDTLAEAAIQELFALVVQAERTGEVETAGRLADELRRFGSRSAKHLTDLTKNVLENEIDLDLTWQAPGGPQRRVSLQRRSAETLQAAIKLNEVDTRQVELVGTLVTVSMTKKTELQTSDLGTIAIDVNEELKSTLGRFYNAQVLVTAEQTTRWSINTGTEKRSYRMLGIRLDTADAETGPMRNREPSS
jgi:hypothetical protein